MSSNDFRPDKVLVFDIKGPQAHFRKFYTNSSSLSYTAPPRTVISGIIAAILGMPSEHHTQNEEEIYYSKFLPENSFITVSLKTQVRKIMQTVNYYNLKFQNYSLRYQVPLEIITPVSGNEIVYRIYFSHQDFSIYNELKNRLIKQNPVYPIFLGLSEFIASIDFIGESKTINSSNSEINSVCKLNMVNELVNDSEFKYMTELMPVIFDKERNPGKPVEYIIETSGKMIKGNFTENALIYSVSYLHNNLTYNENISPM